jgi:hypothetical protein
MLATVAVSGGVALAGTSAPALDPGVFFQNEGTLVGWEVSSRTGNLAPNQRGSTIRWSTGLYATKWNTQHDNFRIASTYALAEPANWG